jgi:hypothetical protein
VREQMLKMKPPHLANMYSIQQVLVQSCRLYVPCTFLLCRPEILAGIATCDTRIVVLVLVQVELYSVVSAYDKHELVSRATKCCV